MFQLLLIRHAQSANNALPESKRVPDPGLTPLGHLQAGALAEWLTRYRPTQLFCSGFRRALETTKPVAEKLSLVPTVHPDLFEQGGCYSGYLPDKRAPSSGMSRSEIRENFGDWNIDERISEHGWYHGRDLESDDEAVERSHAVARWILEDILPSNDYRNILVRPALIIHADFKALVLESLLDRQQSTLFFSKRPYQLAEVWNASVTQLTWLGNHWQLDFWNSIGHIPVEQLSH